MAWLHDAATQPPPAGIRAELDKPAFLRGVDADGRAIAEKVIASFPNCPIPEVARLGLGSK